MSISNDCLAKAELDVVEVFVDDREQLFDTIAAEVEQRLAVALADKGRASLLVSGGSSPKPVYERLAKVDLAWGEVQVALVDERWVDESESGSNAAFIKSTLLQDRAGAAPFIPMKNSAATAAQGLDDCERAYQRLPAPFDVLVLGMGRDAHTASLFPQANGLPEALEPNGPNLCAAITAHESDVTGTLVERMSLTLHGILRAKQIVVILTGDEKLAVYREALTSTDFLRHPIAAVLAQRSVPVSLWK